MTITIRFLGAIQVLLQASLGLHEHQTARGQAIVGERLKPLVTLKFI